MKKSIFLLLLICCTLNAYNQIISGTISDIKDRKPINFASVYFNGTMAGTNTDQNGNFKLDISKHKSMPLTVSALGYYSLTLFDYSPDKPVKVFMNQKVFELNEVVVSGMELAKARKANMKLFKESFLGTSQNASRSEILNEEDIKFIYDTESDTLKAYSSQPILIKNLALGYSVSYFLDEFELDRNQNSFYFIGNILFKEDLQMDGSHKDMYEKKRRSTYLGSRMQFFRELWNNNLDSAGFRVENSKGMKLNYNDIIVAEDSLLKFMWYPENLTVYYHSANPVSNIIFKDEAVCFDMSGYFDPLNIIWQGQGKLARQLISDWLPYDYLIKE